MLTDKLIQLLVTLGGDPSGLSDRLDITIIDAIIAQINTSAAVTSAEVLTAIEGMNSAQKAAVNTALAAVTSAGVLSAIEGMDSTQVAAVNTALGIS